MFRKIDSEADLRKVLDEVDDDPQFLLLTTPVKLQIARSFPATHLDLYTYRTSSATYYYVYQKNELVVDNVQFCCKGIFVREEFLRGFVEFEKIHPVLDRPQSILFIAFKKFCEPIRDLIIERDIPYEHRFNPTYVYYMTKEQEEVALEYKQKPLPDGYTLGDAKVEDAEVINSTWIFAAKGDLEQSREKIKHLPSSCVRYEGKPVAFEMLHPGGFLNHLFTIEDHRRKGLGTAVEMDIVQKAIRTGLPVFKCVVPTNTEVIKATDRQAFFTKSEEDIIFFVVQPK